MSLPADRELLKKKSEGQRIKRSRNSNRRKSKNMANVKDDECDERIREIINFLSIAITNTCHTRTSNDKPSPVVEGTSTNYLSSFEQHCAGQAKVADADKCTSKKNKFPEANHFTKESVINEIPHKAQQKQNCKYSVSEIEKMITFHQKQNFSSDRNSIEKLKANKVKKSQRKAKVKTAEKVKISQGSNSNSVEEEFRRESCVIVNSIMNNEDKMLKKRINGETTVDDQKETSKSSKSEKKLPVDSKFPKYLTKEEMNWVSTFGILLSGVIRINQKNFKEAYISAPDKGLDILILGLIDRNRALEGDEVYYVLKDQEQFRVNTENGEIQRTAAVVAIKKRQHNRGAVGTIKLQEGNSGIALFLPRDSRIPKLQIMKKDWSPWLSEKSLTFDDRIFYAKITEWNDSRFAKGVLTKEVGSVGNIESETSAILLALELDGTPYPDSLMAYLPELPYVISDDELRKRLDLRKECIFTIDPASAKDLDDAVSCKRLPNGNFQIGVHISDVTHFLRHGTPLDDAVAEKATTIYLVQKVYHMLPRELCELCSLTPGEDKLAFSVMWEMTPDFQVVDSHFSRSVINSCGKFSYDQIQEILDGSENPPLPEIHGTHTVQSVVDTVKILNSIAVHLRKKRFDNGALRIDQTKIVFSLDENGFPLDYRAYINKEAHRLIEEFMLLANITVAERISSDYPEVAFLRSHCPPNLGMMQKIQKYLKNYEIDLDISSSKSIHNSLAKFNGSDPDSAAKMMVLYTLLAKPMSRANYYCSSYFPEDEDRRHFALNIPLYTHFTSPIRRYADVMVHRLLAASMGYSKLPDWTSDYVKMIADNCNKKKYAAKLAGEKSTELFLNIYTLGKGSIICQGAVYDVKQKYFDCVLLENGSQQRVYIENLKLDFQSEKKKNGMLRLIINWPEEENKKSLVQVIDLFTVVKIKLTESKEKRKIKPILLRPDVED